MTLWELTIGYAFEHDGDVQPLVDYLRSGETKDDAQAKEFVAKILTGEIKRGDKRRSRKEARNLDTAFRVRRLVADADVTDADIYETLTAEPNTAERMIKRYRASRKAKRKG